MLHAVLSLWAACLLACSCCRTAKYPWTAFVHMHAIWKGMEGVSFIHSLKLKIWCPMRFVELGAFQECPFMRILVLYTYILLLDERRSIAASDWWRGSFFICMWGNLAWILSKALVFGLVCFCVCVEKFHPPVKVWLRKELPFYSCW